MREFYGNEGGAILSSAVNKYIFITVNRKFDDHIRISYSKTEIVETLDEVKHDLIREAMRLTGVTGGIEITSIADIPSQGTGLGSSSTFTVGALNALYAYKGQHISSEKLANEACRIEIDVISEPIGKQDQYIAAYGGLQFVQFNRDGSVFVDPVVISREKKELLQNSLMLFYTGITRKANSILAEQKSNSSTSKINELKKLKELALEGKKILESNNSLIEFGKLLDESWKIKKTLASGISNEEIDDIYGKAIKAGALGGKILGAGGGGFILLHVPQEIQNNIKSTLYPLKQVDFCFEPQGSKIIYVSD
ncbi:MAG: D-glycero-alpha-D-manno-heptose-7-phosphate kinase [Candidatus Saganbacteria bacterium]|uniref:D-glycero-alpha-D-manno-heptose-7-phosphate kinase n=1 Tax=Candidatus Saganbacteria bacterium TaxID=2575572 RepID=A0A833L578_UNCSA|nr:MAG: D-glycero-alpha-D-manno-heptose-7-phosphate kinase [Candidatus Saganbacteria bacterium]